MGKQAIKEARKQIKVAYKLYRREVKKHKLFSKQARVQATLKKMGVPNRRINVICYDTPAQKIKVRIGVPNGTISVSN
jgi:hypothetical protein